MLAITRSILLIAALLHAVCAEDGINTPWTSEWSMTLKGTERWYVEYNKKNYLEVIETDLEDLQFLIGKDIMIQAKFKLLELNNVQFYNFPSLKIGSDSESWSTILDGDNVYILGKASGISDKIIDFKTAHVLRAPSDAAVIAQKRNQIANDDYDALIQLAEWVRKTGNNMGNRAVWITAADNIVDDCIIAVSKKAKETQNVHLLLKAMTWSSMQLSDKSRAAKLGSQEWVSALAEDEAKPVIERMNILGLVQHDGVWMTKREQKVADFKQKLQAIDRNNDQAYYDLAMDIAQYRDALPEALELKHQALQTGLRYNPKSNALRKALGKKTVEQEIAENGLVAAYVDASTGLNIPVPAGWQRSKETIDGDVTWIDPNSDTAYISLTAIPGTKADAFAELFDKQLETYKSKPGFSEGNSEALGIAGASKEARFGFKEGREDRQAILACVLFIKQETAYVLYVGYLEEELNSAESAYKHILKAFEDHKEEGQPAVEKPAVEAAKPTEKVKEAPAKIEEEPEEVDELPVNEER